MDAKTLLLDAWTIPDALLPNLPQELRPRDEQAAYALQHAVMAGLGEIGGWKVGAPGPDAPPNCAPMPLSGLQATPARLPRHHTPRAVESEIAFRLAHDLPPRATPYTRAEVIAAIGSCHPALEVVQSRFEDDTLLDAPTRLADFLSHGGFVHGPARPDWQSVDFATLGVEQRADGLETRAGIGNPAGDMIRLVTWMANTGASWAGGLRAGQFVTCGSWTGKVVVPAGATVHARFAGFSEVVATFTA